ncbi:hypothetical protein B0H21DRAFT_724747 [Amylocystis lapponica]|nr:hypothetical protein B0H21DRAFT_724747 [Amylocystis lapponica]
MKKQRDRAPSRPSSRKHTVTPELVHTDVILAMHTGIIELIERREKNHEFRQYKLRPDVVRLWLYETAPICAITCILETTIPKVPGELRDPGGAGNVDFDAGLGTKYAYPIRGLRKLKEPVGRADLKARFGVTSPRGFCYTTQQMVEELKLDEMERVF